jgi:hypothetical protein
MPRGGLAALLLLIYLVSSYQHTVHRLITRATTAQLLQPMLHHAKSRASCARWSGDLPDHSDDSSHEPVIITLASLCHNPC